MGIFFKNFCSEEAKNLSEKLFSFRQRENIVSFTQVRQDT